MLLASSCAAAFALDACNDPTQVTIDITTLGFSCHELKRVTVVVAGDPEAAEDKTDFPQAEVTTCDSDKRVGTLVLTPGQDRGAVMVLASYTDQRCQKPDYKGCIVARRVFSFVDHVKLTLPIALEASCRDVPCGVLSSCRSGKCVSSQTSCASDGTCTSDAQPVVDDKGNVVPADGGSGDSGGEGNDGGGTTMDGGPPMLDAAADGRPLVFGNACPSNPPGGDCLAMNNSPCCADQGGWRCDTTATVTSPIPPVPPVNPPVGGPCGGATFNCTGRAHCDLGKFCCSGGTLMPGLNSTCAAPTASCGLVLCNTSDDCPNPSMSCIDWAQGPIIDGGRLRHCAP